MKGPRRHLTLAVLAAFAALSVTAPALAESWKTVYKSANYANSGRSQEVDLDSVQRSGAVLKYRAHEVNSYGHSEQVMVTDCAQMTRGQWQDMRMYSVYPNTLGGDEVQAICQFAQRSGLISPAESSIPPSEASAPDARAWTPASKDGTRQIRLASLRTHRPLVSYRFRFGEADRYSEPTDTELVVEVNCERRTRRDALAWFGTPLGAPHSVDSYGSGFREELDLVCRWAQAQWDGPDASKFSGSKPAVTVSPQASTTSSLPDAFTAAPEAMASSLDTTSAPPAIPAISPVQARPTSISAQAPATAVATPPTPSADSIPKKLRELDKLRKEGVISQKDFETKKQELLKAM